ncbi:MAG: hypothetical protein KDA61_08190, partial [Planctomycetales bacterium]|nr:hypothetical protein [Planctomycetales bacterium]
MTWHAQDGQIVLAGGESDLLRDAVLCMCDAILSASDDEESFFEGAKVFDDMSRSQQLASLEVVARYLFHPTPACLPLTAWSEATLASVLREVRSLVQMEIDEGEKEDCRRVLAEALEIQGEIENFNDSDEWDCLLDAYDDRFLWDNDFEDDEATDLPPEFALQSRRIMGIGDDYYASIPPDLPAAVGLEQAAKRVWIAIDGKKTFKLSATLTCELPASLSVETIDDDLKVLRRVLPRLDLLQV